MPKRPHKEHFIHSLNGGSRSCYVSTSLTWGSQCFPGRPHPLEMVRLAASGKTPRYHDEHPVAREATTHILLSCPGLKMRPDMVYRAVELGSVVEDARLIFGPHFIEDSIVWLNSSFALERFV
ncbi:hypothetical protein N7463_004512 [Penicillium fimorum]|uniref:Uncharacterized protein n=1 Tax=Penicillium fimorum TaxID=1882269 RepID=A0A9W9Y3X3_9EURO|nr:hypothetical protein N7463_004512 [Penicillium fimorum]